MIHRGLEPATGLREVVRCAAWILLFTALHCARAATLAESVDATNLVWSTGGAAAWQPQSGTTHDGVDAAQSGAVSDLQESWLQTTVTGPGTLTFWWKVSSEDGYDELRFLFDGVEQINITGEIDWQQRSLAVAAGSHTLRWNYAKDASTAAGADRGWLDQVVFTPPQSNVPVITLQPASRTVAEGANVVFNVAASGNPPPRFQWYFNGGAITQATNSTFTVVGAAFPSAGAYFAIASNSFGSVTSAPAILTVTALGPALEAPGLSWLPGGNASWFAQTNCTHDGADAVESGAIGPNEECWIQTTVNGPGILSFWWKVSSETNYDGVEFLTNGVVARGLTGEIDWQSQEVDLPPGPQTLRWRYRKDGTFSQGLDRGWLDEVSYVPLPTLSIADAIVVEGDSGVTNLAFVVSLSAPLGRTVTVAFASSNGTAVAGGDYTPTNGLVIFAPGATNQAILVRVHGDRLYETNETLFLNLSAPVNALIGDGLGIGTILGDDLLPAPVTIKNLSRTTAGGLLLTVDCEPNRLYTLETSTNLAAWTAVTNLASSNNFLTFTDPAAGGYQRRFYRVSGGRAVPAVRIHDVVVTEGDSGTTNALFTVSLSTTSEETVTVSFTTADITAAAGADYLATNGVLNFDPGVTNQTITVVLNGDSYYETDETFEINLGNPVNAALADSQALGTLLNDDPEPVLVAVSAVSLAPNGDFILSFAGQSNRTYQVFTSTNLATWQFLTNVTSASNSLQLIHPGAGAEQRRFYQIWIGP